MMNHTTLSGQGNIWVKFAGRPANTKGSGHFQNVVRVLSTDFELLINQIGHKIGKKYTKLIRKAVAVKKRLALTKEYNSLL